jgi:hypothetical protein
MKACRVMLCQAEMKNERNISFEVNIKLFAPCHFGKMKYDTKRNHIKAFNYRSSMSAVHIIRTMTTVYTKRFPFWRRRPVSQQCLINSLFMPYPPLLHVTLYETPTSVKTNAYLLPNK